MRLAAEIQAFSEQDKRASAGAITDLARVLRDGRQGLRFGPRLWEFGWAD